MAKPKEVEKPAASIRTFEIIGLVKSDFMPIKVEDRQVDLANVTPEVTAWLYERREQLPWLKWAE